MNTSTPRLVRLVDRAIELQIPYRRAYDLALSGKLGRVERGTDGRLYVELAPTGNTEPPAAA